MPDDKHSCVCSGDTSTREDEEEEDSDDFFDAGEGLQWAAARFHAQ